MGPAQPNPPGTARKDSKGKLVREGLGRKELKEALDYFGQIDPETVPKGRWKLYLSLSKQLEAAKAQPEG